MGKKIRTNAKLDLASRKILQRAKLVGGENLVVTSSLATDGRIVEAIIHAAEDISARPMSLTVPSVTKDNPFEEPPEMFTEALKRADLIVPIVRFSSYSKAYREILKRTRVLGFALPPTTDQVIDWTLNMDYERTDKLSKVVTNLLYETDEFRITSTAGTDVTMRLGKRHVADDPGKVEKVGDENYLPGACVDVAPLEETWNGRIVFDGLLYPPIGLLSNPISLEVSNGMIEKLGGKNAQRFRKWLDHFDDQNMFRMSHIGIGLNPKFTKFTGKKSIDERIYGIVGTGIGTNDIPVFGGTIRAKGHTDGYMRSASVYLDGEPLIKNGAFAHSKLKGIFSP